MADPTARTINFYNYVFTSPLGFIGHTCSVITFSSRNLRQTSTGLLFLCLTIADALYQLMFIYDFVVQTLQIGTTSSTHLCRFRTLILNFSIMVSAWILVLIACDRFIRVRFPHHQTNICRRKVVLYSVLILCLISFGFNAHLLYPDYPYFNRGTNVCGLARAPVTPYTYFYFNVWPILQVLIYYFLPICLMLFGLIGVCLKLRSQRTTVQVSTRRTKLQQHMLLLMVSSVICFALCTLPQSIHRVINLRFGSNSSTPMILSIMNIFFNINYSYNFYLRCLTSKLFRETFLQQIRFVYYRCHNRPIPPKQTSVHPMQTVHAYGKGPQSPTADFK